MPGELPSLDAIERDYATLKEYAKDAATCVPEVLRRKRFHKHVPTVTQETHRCWARDRWIAFESLPRVFREMVNDDPSHPDEALDVALAMWAEIEHKAEQAMDRILEYESALVQIANLPDWLKGVSLPEMEAINFLREDRLELLRKQLEEAERRQQEQKAREKLERGKKITRYQPATVMEDWLVKQDNKWKRLNEIDNEVRMMRLPPHLAREMLEKKKAEVLEVKRVTHVRPAGFYTYDGAKAAATDNEVPLKFHPKNFQRGKNS